MKKLRVILVILLVLLIGTFALAEGSDTPALSKDVQILFTSDIHCAVDQGWGYGGIYAVKQGLSRDYHVLLADDGDAIQGEPIGLLTHGEALIRLMNAAGYDIAIPGNHVTMFRDAAVLNESGTADSSVLLEYITGLDGGIIGEEYADPYGQGRIVSTVPDT